MNVETKVEKSKKTQRHKVNLISVFVNPTDLCQPNRPLFSFLFALHFQQISAGLPAIVKARHRKGDRGQADNFSSVAEDFANLSC
jgi:hypothetical protein